MTTREPIIGIDLGTTFSLVAVCDERGVRVLPDENGETRLPSVIGLRPDDPQGRMLVGWSARSSAVENARTTVYSVKRLLGRTAAELAQEAPYLAYALRSGPRDTVQIEVGDRRYAPEEISALILSELRDRAERHLGCAVHKVVITVPAYFDDAQRQATRNAARAAGLDVVRILNEPTAAALAYGIGLRHADAPAPRQTSGTSVALPMPGCHSPQSAATPASASQTVAIYDLGGGTFDVSILRLEQGIFQVLATAGDTHLGGDDFDRVLIDLVQLEVREQFDMQIDSPRTRQALRGLAEAVKIRLSQQLDADLELEIGRGRVYRRKITRAEFEHLTASLLDRTIALLRRALRDARLTEEDLHQVVLVGGSTRMPQVREAVAAAIGRPPYTALNPDEVVAEGAALQAALLAGQPLDMLLLDVTPLSLGIETMGGAMGKVILRNSAIPCRATEMFTTFVDGQTAIRVSVLQGERELAADCRKLAEFELRGIPPMPAGIPKVELQFLIDANGILNVSARELRSGVQAAVQVAPHRGLTRDEVEQITRESIAHGRADLDAHRRIDLRNQVAFDTHKAEQMLERVGHRLSDSERVRLAQDIEELREMADADVDLDALHHALDRFGRSTLRLAEIGITEALRP